MAKKKKPSFGGKDTEAIREAVERSRANKGGRTSMTAWESKGIPQGTPPSVSGVSDYIPEGKPNFDLKRAPVENPPSLWRSAPTGTPPNAGGQWGYAAKPNFEANIPVLESQALVPVEKQAATAAPGFMAKYGKLGKWGLGLGAAAYGGKKLYDYLTEDEGKKGWTPEEYEAAKKAKNEAAEQSKPVYDNTGIGSPDKSLFDMVKPKIAENFKPEDSSPSAPVSNSAPKSTFNIPEFNLPSRPGMKELPKDEEANYLYAALLSAIPTALGGILGGYEGAAVGAGAGEKGISTYFGGIDTKNKKEAEKVKEANKLSRENYDQDVEGAIAKQKFDLEGAKAKLDVQKNQADVAIRQAKLLADLENMKSQAGLRESQAKAYEAKALKEAKGKGGRDVPHNVAVSIGEARTGLSALDKLEALISQNKGALGPYAGRASMLAQSLGIDTKGAKINSEMDLYRQIIGVAMEKGVLREGDWKKYQVLLPTVKDTQALALEKVRNAREILTHLVDSKEGELARFGYNVPGYPIQATDMTQENPMMEVDGKIYIYDGQEWVGAE